MAIKPPAWCSDAIPTPNGWKHPRTTEILKSGKIKQEDIDEYFMAETGAPDPMVLRESPVTTQDVIEEYFSDYTKMTKAEMIDFADEYGIELNNSMTKDEMIEIMEEYDLED